MRHIRKISADDVTVIIGVIKGWTSQRLTWELLRVELAKCEAIDLPEAWSRQALADQSDILNAFSVAKRRIRAARALKMARNDGARVDDGAFDAGRIERNIWKEKYDRLLIKHQQLIFNASLLPGGLRLFALPLPDNTRSQGGSRRREEER